jgi:Mrp family chromosome partitioning ATPase
VLPVTDAQVLSRLADVTLLVAAHGETSKRGLSRALELLEQVGASVVGTAFNLVANERSYGGYAYRYEAHDTRQRRLRRATATPTEGMALHARSLAEAGDPAPGAPTAEPSRRRNDTSNATPGVVADRR